MLANAFTGKPQPPTDAELTAALGASRALWNQLLADLAGQYQLDWEWHQYSPKAGWSARVKTDKRNIAYLSPSTGAFMASFALSDKAIAAVREGRFSKKILHIIDSAKKYAEGTAVRLDVKTSADTAAVLKLAGIKLSH